MRITNYGRIYTPPDFLESYTFFTSAALHLWKNFFDTSEPTRRYIASEWLHITESSVLVG